jgi:hypothetical protein
MGYISETYKNHTIEFIKSKELYGGKIVLFKITNKYSTQYDDKIDGSGKSKKEAFEKAKNIIDKSSMTNMKKIKTLWNKKPSSNNYNAVIGSKILIWEKGGSFLTRLDADGTTIQGDYYEKTMKPFIESLGYHSEFEWGMLD